MDTLPGDKKDARVMQSTISRFACRILVDRSEPSKARIYAAGFDSSRNIFLGVSFKKKKKSNAIINAIHNGTFVKMSEFSNKFNRKLRKKNG